MISAIRLGPLYDDGSDVPLWIVVAFSAGRYRLTHGRTEAEALLMLMESADGEEVCCEPALAEDAKRLGLRSAAPPAMALKAAACVAIELVSSGLKSPEHSINLVLLACARFMEKKPWRRWRRRHVLTFAVDVSGAVDGYHELLLLRTSDEEGHYALTLFEEKGATQELLDCARRGEHALTSSAPGIYMVMSEKPVWAVDIVRRAYGLGFLALASHRGRDGSTACTVPEAAAVAATLVALTRINENMPEAIGTIDTLYGTVRVQISATAP